MSRAHPKPSPYSGIRLLDLTRVLAGPYATLVLADLGAEVIKIENTLGGDDSRQFQPPVIHDISTYFLSVNRNKKSVAIDLKRDAGRQLFLDLARQSDVVVENFRTGVVERSASIMNRSRPSIRISFTARSQAMAALAPAPWCRDTIPPRRPRVV